MKLGMNVNHPELVLTNMMDAQNCMVGAVVEGIVGYRYIFQSFCYVRTIFPKVFAPEVHLMFFIWLPEKAQDNKTNVIKVITI
jgi:hypothetical protein